MKNSAENTEWIERRKQSEELIRKSRNSFFEWEEKTVEDEFIVDEGFLSIKRYAMSPRFVSPDELSISTKEQIDEYIKEESDYLDEIYR